jgi:hypothetical protein
VTKVLAIALGALGLGYACLWWSFQRFYGEFGVSPQDVGMAPSGSSSDLAGAALELGVWLLIVLAVLAFLPVAAIAAVEIAAASWKKTRRRAVMAAVAAAVLLGVTAFLYWRLVDGWVGLGTLAVAGVVYLLVRLLIHVLVSTAAAVGPQFRLVTAVSDRATKYLDLVAVVVALAAAVVGITFIDLPTDAAQAGRCAATERKSVPALNLPLPGLHLPILSVHAQPASLTWLSGSPHGAIPSPDIVYLGQANGSVVVYHRVSRKASRIPAGDVVVSIDSTVPKCSGVH